MAGVHRNDRADGGEEHEEWCQVRDGLTEALESKGFEFREFSGSVHRAVLAATDGWRSDYAHRCFLEFIRDERNKTLRRIDPATESGEPHDLRDGLTLQELASICGCSQGTLSRLLQSQTRWEISRYEQIMAFLDGDTSLLHPQRGDTDLNRTILLAAVNAIRTEWLHERSLLPGYESACFSEPIDPVQFEALLVSQSSQPNAKNPQLIPRSLFTPFLLACFILDGTIDGPLTEDLPFLR